MASKDKLNVQYTGVNSITLEDTTVLSLGKMATSGSIPMDAGGLYTVYITPSGFFFEPMFATFLVMGGAGVVTNLIGEIVAGVSADQILPSTTFTNFRDPGAYWVEPFKGLVKRCGPGDVVSFNITNPVAGTSPIMQVTLFGQLIPT